MKKALFLLVSFFSLNAQKVDEKLYISLQKEQFGLADSIVFELKLFAQNRKDQSHVVYVELISSDNQLIAEKTLRIDQSLESVFKIDSSFASGRYQIRAYTNYLAGLGQNAVFKRTIFIGENVVSQNPIIAIHPEGGQLTEGLPNNVLIQTETPNITGQIIDDEANDIIGFKTDDEGAALFPFTPQGSKKYRIRLDLSETDVRFFEMPKAQSMGVALAINTKEDDIVSKIYSTDKSSDSLTLAIFNKQELVDIQRFKNNTTNIFRLKTAMLPQGLLEFVVLNDAKKQMAKRVFLNSETATFSSNQERYLNLDFYLKSNLISSKNGTKDINQALISQQMAKYDTSLVFEKEQFLSRVGVAYDSQKNELKNDEIYLYSSSKNISFQKINTDEKGQFIIAINEDAGLIELKIQDSNNKPVNIKWLPRNVLPIDESHRITNVNLASSGIELPFMDGKQLEEVVVKARKNFDKARRKAGINYFVADKSIDKTTLIDRSFGTTDPLMAISASFVNIRKMYDAETGRDWLFSTRRGKNSPIAIFEDGVSAPQGSELLPVHTIFKIEQITTIDGPIVYIYSKGFMDVFGENKTKNTFDGNAIVRGFDR
jgi:hypothetical protein